MVETIVKSFQKTICVEKKPVWKLRFSVSNLEKTSSEKAYDSAIGF